MSQPSRRRFLRTVAGAGASAGLGEWAGLLPLSPASADDAKVTPDLVRFGPDIEPVVRLIEDTPRDKCVAMLVDQLKKGLPYRNFLAALYLANIRVNFVYHTLGSLHATDQLALDAPVQERLLPAFWALDSFKFHQDRGKKTEFAPSLKPLTGKLPSAGEAEKEFHEGMKAFDPDRAERAIAVMVRTQGAARVIEPFWHYGARDWDFIGHIPIWVSNVLRALPTVGWQHAESTMRVLARTVPCEGFGKPKDQVMKTQPYAANLERVQQSLDKLPADWAAGGANPAVTGELLTLIREGRPNAAGERAAKHLVDGKARAGAVWDAVHLAGGEMIMCAQNTAEPLHANTAANALHYAFQASGEPANRLLILLQAVSWMCLYRNAMIRKKWITEPKMITELVAAEIPARQEEAIEAILAHLTFGGAQKPKSDSDQGKDDFHQPWRQEGAQRVFAFAKRFADPLPLVRAANRLLPLKTGWDPHQVKFSVAAWENVAWVSDEWRPHMLAAASFSFSGADAPDTDLAKQVREAVRKL